MRLAGHHKARFSGAGIIFVWLALAGMPARAQTQRKAPSRSSSSQENQDPLAALLQQASDAIDKMDFAAALDPLQRYIAQRPDDPYAHFQLGYSYVGLKRSDDAKTEFSRAVALDPKMAAAHLNLGLVLMDSDPVAATAAFLHAAELQPAESRPRFLAGFSFELAGEFTEAIEQYRAALALSPKDYEVHFGLGRALLRNGEAAAAEAQFREAAAEKPDSAPALLGLGNALLTQRKYEAANDALEGYLKLNPGDRAAHFARASSLFELDRYDDALGELDQAGAGSAQAADQIKMRGNIYMLQRKWKEAGETLTQALLLSPKDAEVAGWLGHVDIELHQFPEAINILNQVHTQNPQSVEPLRDLVNAFYLNQNYAAAIGAMDRLAKLETPQPGSWFNRAICYDKLSDKAEAIDSYQKFLDQDKGEHDTQDFQARQRMLTLQHELGQRGNKSKK